MNYYILFALFSVESVFVRAFCAQLFERFAPSETFYHVLSPCGIENLSQGNVTQVSKIYNAFAIKTTWNDGAVGKYPYVGFQTVASGVAVMGGAQ